MAMRINLLDWRAARRERVKQQFVGMLGLSAMVSAAIVGLIWFSVLGDIADQKARNQYLQDQITEAEAKIKEIEDLERTKSNLLARMKVIEELQASRSASVHFFDEIVNTLPEGVSVTAIKQQGTSVTVDGVAESNGRVSTYMKNIESSRWFAAPKLVVIKTLQKDGRRQSEFTLQFNNLTQAKPDQEDGGAQ
jgi:type IV pilus assembly protein PilN